MFSSVNYSKCISESLYMHASSLLIIYKSDLKCACPAGGQGVKLLAHNAACLGLLERMPLSLRSPDGSDGLLLLPPTDPPPPCR
jgi:hypothetical protein